MAILPAFTEAAIRQIATSQSFSRGRSYYERGAVLRVMRRGDEVQAEVEGSRYAPYQVRITLDATGISDTHCTCPYDWGGACKHVVAVLLACLHEPERVKEREPVDRLLAELEPEQLRAILSAVVERQPDLADLIESQVLAEQEQPAAESGSQYSTRQRRTAIDSAAYRRQVSAALRSLDRMRPSEAYWHVGEVVDEVRRAAEQARPFIEAGDGRSALTILEAMTEEYVAGWTGLDDSDGEASGFFADLGALWTEAILSADLTPDEREAWADRLTQWQAEVGEYGVDEAFDAAEAAALQGWDDPQLQRILRGETFDDEGAKEPLWYAEELSVARLKVLERQGRNDEYLNFARAMGQRTSYVTMLVRSGRITEAADCGLTALATSEEALALCRALDEYGATQEALRVAERGLTLEGGRAMLARWLRERASAVGQTEQALDAALLAMRESPSLADYQAIQALAGESWPAVREHLLARLRQSASSYPQAQVDVFLYEGLIDDAIAAVEPAPYQYTLVEQVVDAAIKSHPDWVIRVCCQQAERIADGGKAKHYHHAVRWLEKARSAYLASGRGAEWSSYLEELIARHGRKYSLVPMLKRLL